MIMYYIYNMENLRPKHCLAMMGIAILTAVIMTVCSVGNAFAQVDTATTIPQTGTVGNTSAFSPAFRYGTFGGKMHPYMYISALGKYWDIATTQWVKIYTANTSKNIIYADQFTDGVDPGFNGTTLNYSSAVYKALEAAHAMGGGTIMLSIKDYKPTGYNAVDGRVMTYDNITIMGQGSGDYNATQTRIVGGSVLQGGLSFYANNFSAINLSSDAGKYVCDTYFGGAIRDAFFDSPPVGSITLVRGLYESNIKTLVYAQNSLAHGNGVEAVSNAFLDNITTCHGFAGLVLKGQNIVVGKAVGFTHGSYGMIIKSDNVYGAPARDVSVADYSYYSLTNGGSTPVTQTFNEVAVNLDAIFNTNLTNIRLESILNKGSRTVAVDFTPRVTGADPNKITNVSIGTVISENTAAVFRMAGVYMENLHVQNVISNNTGYVVANDISTGLRNFSIANIFDINTSQTNLASILLNVNNTSVTGSNLSVGHITMTNRNFAYFIKNGSKLFVGDEVFDNVIQRSADGTNIYYTHEQRITGLENTVITGNGILSNIPVFSGNRTLTSSALYQAGNGNFGVNTANPLGEFVFKSRVYNSGLEMNGDALGISFLSYDRVAGAHAKYGIRASQIYFSPNDVQAYYIDSNGHTNWTFKTITKVGNDLVYDTGMGQWRWIHEVSGTTTKDNATLVVDAAGNRTFTVTATTAIIP